MGNLANNFGLEWPHRLFGDCLVDIPVSLDKVRKLILDEYFSALLNQWVPYKFISYSFVVTKKIAIITFARHCQ